MNVGSAQPNNAKKRRNSSLNNDAGYSADGIEDDEELHSQNSGVGMYPSKASRRRKKKVNKSKETQSDGSSKFSAARELVVIDADSL